MDFLTFKTFISPSILIGIYYLGVLVVPLLAIWKRQWIARGLNAAEAGSGISKWRWFAAAVGMFVMFQIGWRMMFEFIIGYLQMRAYLQQLAG